MKIVYFRKGALVVLFLIFLSSCSQNCPQWVREDISSPCPQYSSSRLYVSPTDLFCLLELELVRDCTEERLYVNVLSVEICDDERHPGQTPVVVSIDGIDNKMMAARFQGGQRFLLPDYGRGLVVEAFAAGKPVTVSISRYKQTFPAKNFSESY